MANNVVVVQKMGKQSLESQVEALAKQGWALGGSPTIVQGLPAQVMVKTETLAANPGYLMVVHDVNREVTTQVSALRGQGWKMYGNAFEFSGNCAQAMIRGDIKDYDKTDSGGTGPGGETIEVGVAISHLGNLGTYELVAEDIGKYLIFDFEGDLKITLPSIAATDAKPFLAFVVNTKGRVDFESALNITAFAPHAEKGVTVGCMKGVVSWYLTGTNTALENS